MSRREGRDSRRRHSKFDREPSPKISKRDEKQERDRDRDRGRVISSANHENGIGGRTDRYQKDRHQLRVAIPPEAPLAHDPKQEARAVNKDTDKKPNYYNEAPKRPSNPTEVPRSSSYFQHDERSSTGQVGQSSGRMATGERGWWKDSREQLIEKESSHRRDQRDEKLHAKPDNNTSLRKDGHSERRYDLPPTTKKRPAFREKKIPVDHKGAKLVATETVKSNQTDHALERNERREERNYNPRHLNRSGKQQHAGDRAPNKNEARRDVFSSRGRYNSNYGGGRERFHGREDFRFSTKTGADKWKHDLYQEVDKDPTSKNEDDQTAKLEALLAS